MAGQIAELGHDAEARLPLGRHRVLLVEATDRVLGAFPSRSRQVPSGRW